MWTRIDRAFKVPAEVRATVATLVNAGFETYLVGGAVRDFLLQKPVKDYDIATRARPEEVLSLFSRVIEVGRAFGVLKVITETGLEIEVTTFRSESDYRDHRHPEKVEFSDVENDSNRRDFTINALYFDLKTSQVLDFHGGLDDLKTKTLRAIGDPETRFEEDALRLLRAVRFAGRFAFTLSPETAQAIKLKSPLIREVSLERVRDEFEKILSHPHSLSVILEMDALGVFENVMPEIAVARMGHKKVWDQTQRVLQNLGHYPIPEVPALYWALFFLPTLRLEPIEKRDKEVPKIASRLKLSQNCASTMAYLVRETPKFREAFSMRQATLYRWMREPQFELLMRFHQLDAMSYDGNLAGLEFVKAIYPEAKRRFDRKPLITGDDLVRLGLSPGKAFTEILRKVEDLALEGELDSSDAALNFVLQNYV